MEGFLFQDGIGLNLALKPSRRDILPESGRESRKCRSKALDLGVFFLRYVLFFSTGFKKVADRLIRCV